MPETSWDHPLSSSIRLQVANPIEHLGCNKLPIMETGTSKEQKVTMSALKGLVSVSFCVILCQQSTRTKTESHLLTSTRRPQQKAAPLCEKYSKTCVTYVIGTVVSVVWNFIHTAVLLNATACNHIKIGHRDTHQKGLQKDEDKSSIRQHKLNQFWFPSYVFKPVVQIATTWTSPSRCRSMRAK